MNADNAALDRLSERIIGCAFTVSNTLGVGFLERVYGNALALEMAKAGLKAKQQHGITVRYDGVSVGEYVADFLVEDAIVVELKVARTLDDVHRAQCLNYLKATGLTVCLLLNFGKPRLEIKRIVSGF
jgi:GxxExxY protein